MHDQSFFAALDTQHKTFTPTCDYDTYLRILGESEVCFMPLGDTAFNRAKSDLKFIEAGACRVATLASTVVYGDSIEDGRTGLLFRDPTEFRAGLLRLVAMPELAQDLGRRGPPVCRGSSHAGLSGGASDRLVSVAVGPAGGLGGGASGAHRASHGRLMANCRGRSCRSRIQATAGYGSRPSGSETPKRMGMTSYHGGSVIFGQSAK